MLTVTLDIPSFKFLEVSVILWDFCWPGDVIQNVWWDLAISRQMLVHWCAFISGDYYLNTKRGTAETAFIWCHKVVVLSFVAVYIIIRYIFTVHYRGIYIIVSFFFIPLIFFIFISVVCIFCFYIDEMSHIKIYTCFCGLQMVSFIEYMIV